MPSAKAEAGSQEEGERDAQIHSQGANYGATGDTSSFWGKTKNRIIISFSPPFEAILVGPTGLLSAVVKSRCRRMGPTSAFSHL